MHFRRQTKIIVSLLLACMLLSGCGARIMKGKYYTAYCSREAGGSKTLEFSYIDSAIGTVTLTDSAREAVREQSTGASQIMLADGHRISLDTEVSDADPIHNYGIRSDSLQELSELLAIPLCRPSGLEEPEGRQTMS